MVKGTFRRVRLIRGKPIRGSIIATGNIIQLDSDIILSLGKKVAVISRGRRKITVPSTVITTKAGKPRFRKVVRELRTKKRI